VQAGDGKALRDAGGALVEHYPRTLYAAMGALTAARFHFDRGDAKSAKAQLQWVIERSASDELRDIARLRLAALLLDEKAYDEALKALESKHGEAFAAQYALLGGDILAAQGRQAEAKTAYKLALEKAEKKDESFRAGVQLRLDALGG
jgi:predicted negative regulator of RcsB-dependent stress response